MHPDVEALLAVQEDDVVIHELESKLAELAPRIAAMQTEIDQATASLAQAHQAVETEERRHRDVQGRIGQHRQLQERNQAQLNSISDARAAAAAMAQLDQARRMIDEDERELAASNGRLAELRHTVAVREQAVEDLRRAQEQARASLDADSADLQRQLEAKRRDRKERAARVPRALLSRYDRIARRHVHAVYPLRGHSCGHCDTTLPLQRRSAMRNGATEICEGCGVLLYATE